MHSILFSSEWGLPGWNDFGLELVVKEVSGGVENTDAGGEDEMEDGGITLLQQGALEVWIIMLLDVSSWKFTSSDYIKSWCWILATTLIMSPSHPHCHFFQKVLTIQSNVSYKAMIE